MLKDEYKVYEEKMKKSIESVMSDFDTVRAGRANASVLNRISVDYYGTPTPIQQIASVSTPDARSLLIQPWDASVLKGIEKAILASDLGLNPQNDGRTIRLIFPALTEERRRDLVKQVKKYGEEAKVAVRNIRRDAMEAFKKKQKASEITEELVAAGRIPYFNRNYVAPRLTELKEIGILTTVGRRKATRSDATEAVWARAEPSGPTGQTAAAYADNPTEAEQMTLGSAT